MVASRQRVPWKAMSLISLRVKALKREHRSVAIEVSLQNSVLKPKVMSKGISPTLHPAKIRKQLFLLAQTVINAVYYHFQRPTLRRLIMNKIYSTNTLALVFLMTLTGSVMADAIGGLDSSSRRMVREAELEGYGRKPKVDENAQPSILIQNKVDEYRDAGRRVFVYELPEVYQDDYVNILRGYWSKLSEDAKNRILSFWEETDDSFIYGILYHKPNKHVKAFYKKYTEIDPVKDLKNDEYWYKPNLVVEVLGL